LDLVEARKLVENRHPWELARAAFFDRLILRLLDRSRPVRVLDVGCGDGWFSRQLLPRLSESSTLVGWDTALDDDLLGVFSTDLPAGMTLTRTKPAGVFDLILCMDVLEHVPDDLALLVDLKERLLDAAGYFLMSVPAWNSLFSKHDLALRHYRRYSPREGLELMQAGGLTVLRKGGLFHGLAAVRALQVARWGRARPLEDPASYTSAEDAVGLGAWKAPRPITHMVSAILETEGWFSGAVSRAGLELPGLTWWALCRKP
jgi:SAM-dependent methyltransferase